MGEKVKVTESKGENVIDFRILQLIYKLEQRIMRMERAFDALGRRLEGSDRHVEDEGWFD